MKSLNEKINEMTQIKNAPYMSSVIYDINDKCVHRRVALKGNDKRGTIKLNGKTRKVLKDHEYSGVVKVYALMD